MEGIVLDYVASAYYHWQCPIDRLGEYGGRNEDQGPKQEQLMNGLSKTSTHP
jgi:hypothetical protein